MMEWVVFSDIHGNYEALRSLLEAEKPNGKRQYLFLGDVVGYYYDAEPCVSLLKDIPDLTAVRGNHDQMYLDAFSDPVLTEQFVQKYSSSYRDKKEAVRDYLDRLPTQIRLQHGGTEILLQHGTPKDPLEGRIYPDMELPVEGDDHQRVILSGHTHYQMVRTRGSTCWLNPGSLGQPRDGKGFSYGVLSLSGEGKKPEICCRIVKPDLTNLERQIRERDPDHSYLWEVLHRKQIRDEEF